MRAFYRVVHFVPDPFSESRIPIAALVGSGPEVQLAHAKHVPGPSCIGASESALLKSVLRTLSAATSLDALPPSTGPHGVLGPPRSVPTGVEDPLEWVERFVLPTPVSIQKRASRERAAKRSTVGYRYFQTWHVAHFVKKRFHPEVEWNIEDPSASVALAPISHYCGSDQVGMLLMEPVVPAPDQFAESTQKVYERMAAYSVYIGHHPSLREKNQLSVYILPGGTRDARHQIRSVCSPVANVVDTEIDRERDGLLSIIQHYGAQAADQGEIPN